MELVDLSRREDLRLAARSLFASSRGEVDLVDLAFDAIWAAAEGSAFLEKAPENWAMDEAETVNPDRSADGKSDSKSRLSTMVSTANPKTLPENGNPTVDSAAGAYSADESLRRKDFSRFSDVELAEVQKFLRSIDWKPIERESRRKRSGTRSGEIDMRRLLRHSLRHGGEIISLPRRGNRSKRRRLVLLCDVSGSMDRYSRILLQFLHCVESNFGGSEVFVFGTRLTRITHLLREKDVDAAIATVSAKVQDWSGGTRIGEALGDFNRHWARRAGALGAVVMIISDGWDRGDPSKLRQEVDHLHRMSHRLIWLNPLLGSANYRPVTRGMAAALPYVDDFVPADNLASLEALGRLISQLPRTRGATAQKTTAYQL